MGDEHNALSRSEPLEPTKENDMTCSINEERSPSAEAIELHEFAGSQSYGSFVYREDVVKFNQNESLLGMVQVVAGDMVSDSDTDDDDVEDDDGDDDDGDEEEGGEDDRGAGHEGNDDEGEEAGDADEGGDNRNSALKDGQVSVIWLDNSETTNSLNEVTVVDRGFLHGDIVAAVTDPTGQLGVVMDVDISVDLQSAGNLVIKEVSSKILHRVRDLAVGDYVVHGPWLGRVDDVLDNVTVLFDDGSYCKVLKADPSLLKPVSKNTLADANFPYHPSQRVRATSSSVFKKARWFCGAWKANRLEGTIVKVQAGSVFVYWIASANPGSVSGSVTVPHEEQKPKDLTLLSCLVHSNWQLGDWCLPPTHLLKGLLKSVGSTSHLQGSNKSTGCNDITDPVIVDSEETIPDSNLHRNDRSILSNASRESGSSSNLASVPKENVHEREAVHCKKPRKVVIRRDKKPRKRGEIFDRGFQIVSIRTKVDVAWQDGTREFRRDSKTLIPIDSPGDHEFCAEQYVVEKASDEGEDSNEVKRVGVVKSVSAKDRTACVRWLKPVARPEDPREFANEEVVSVYELEEHPDYDYCYGDVVIRLSPLPMIVETPSSGNADEGQKQQPGSILANGDQKSGELSENCNQTGTDEPDVTFSSVSWVGNITGFEDGDIEVTWADGLVSKVGPQAIYVVVRDDDPESEISDTDAASWETFDGSEDADEDKEEDVSLQNTNGNKSQMEESTLALPEGNNSGRSGPLSIPLAALGFVTRLASGLFTRRGNGSLSVPFLHSDSKNANESEDSDSERGASDGELSSHQSDILDDHLARTTHETREACGAATGGELNMVVENVESLECYEDDLCSFKHFDIAKEPWDHYYLGGSGSNITGGRKWVKKIQQDWSILEKNLPSEIFVRVYEDRMDLLRAVIMGAFGTPYQDGLFFFDFQLPPEYPQVPPSAYYHSGGLRVNPNLYEDGKVCLSLLNTWNGKGNEVWDPSSSSILQVLVSLQGLVLNSKPYFNEAGYDKQVGTAEGEKNSLSYNENTFLLNCKSILYILRRPPKHFEEFVKRHFRRRGYYILKACDEYMKGCLVGSLTKDACKSDRSGEDSNSVGFKLMLGKIVPRLVSALSEVGADCHHFKHLQQT